MNAPSAGLGAALLALALLHLPAGAQSTTRYVRFAVAGDTSYGILDAGTVRELRGDLFTTREPTGRSFRLDAVRLLAPVAPGKVIAVGLNFRSHLGTRPVAAEPGLFAKYPSSIIGPDAEIVQPRGSRNLHYEGEMVLVIGKRASHVRPEDALSYVFGVTAGNDVSERDWQASDLQWFRAKASDTFGPLGLLMGRLTPSLFAQASGDRIQVSPILQLLEAASVRCQPEAIPEVYRAKLRSIMLFPVGDALPPDREIQLQVDSLGAVVTLNDLQWRVRQDGRRGLSNSVGCSSKVIQRAAPSSTSVRTSRRPTESPCRGSRIASSNRPRSRGPWFSANGFSRGAATFGARDGCSSASCLGTCVFETASSAPSNGS